MERIIGGLIEMNKKGQLEFFWVPIVMIVIIGLWLIWAIGIVQYNEYAYEREFGKLKTELKEPGFRWVGFGTLMRVNNQVRSFTIKVDAATKDMQSVNFDVNINARIKKDESYNFIKDYRDEQIFVNYLESKIQERAKTVIFKNNALQLLEERLRISKDVYNEVSTIPELKYFEIKDIALSNIDYSDEYDKIIERKAQVDIERDIILKQKANLELQKKNIDSIDLDKYFKYMLIEKWDGKAPLIISDSLIPLPLR